MSVPQSTLDDETFEALVDNGKSDSANLDSVVELLVQSGKSPTEALMVMVPEAFRSQPALNTRPEVCTCTDTFFFFVFFRFFFFRLPFVARHFLDPFRTCPHVCGFKVLDICVAYVLAVFKGFSWVG